MASKKDFSTLNTGRVYEAIAEATAEPEEQHAQEEQAEQEEQLTGRLASVHYTEAQKQKFLETGKTQGRPGVKATRINMAFYPEQYDYIKTMAQVRGQTITELVNHILKQNMEENRAIYEQAKAFKKAF